MRNLVHSLIPVVALAGIAAVPAAADAAIAFGISAGFAPPPLPAYVQPPIPAAGYIWVPGYWAWGYGGYQWVAGTWQLPPAVGQLWTPGYWGWGNGAYLWHTGYWGPRVGYYGGINYGCGYTGYGYSGGYWRGNQFYYNRSVNNVRNVGLTNVYNRGIYNNVTVNRAGFSGGATGVPQRAWENGAHPVGGSEYGAHAPGYTRSPPTAYRGGQPGAPGQDMGRQNGTGWGNQPGQGRPSGRAPGGGYAGAAMPSSGAGPAYRAGHAPQVSATRPSAPHVPAPALMQQTAHVAPGFTNNAHGIHAR